MNVDEIVAKAQKKSAEFELLKEDRRIRSVMSFLIRKGLLISNYDFGKAPRKILATHCIFTAEHFEPRVYAVLPALLIHFPKAIQNAEKLPKEIHQAVDAIRARKEIPILLKDITFREMNYWAGIPLTDKRVRPIGEKKVMKTFRLAPNMIKKLEMVAKETGDSITQILESAIAKI